jgi:hypothetical protein
VITAIANSQLYIRRRLLNYLRKVSLRLLISRKCLRETKS